jgi:hypothetical protein
MLSCFYWCLWLPSYKIGAKKAALVVHMATLIRILYIKANVVSVCVDKNWAVPGRFFQSLPLPCGAVCASVCRGPEMSRTQLEMFQRQVRVVVAERHTLARSSVSLHRQSVCDRNEVPKWIAPGLKCCSATCGSWWRRDTRKLGKGVLCSRELSAVGR